MVQLIGLWIRRIGSKLDASSLSLTVKEPVDTELIPCYPSPLPTSSSFYLIFDYVDLSPFDDFVEYLISFPYTDFVEYSIFSHLIAGHGDKTQQSKCINRCW